MTAPQASSYPRRWSEMALDFKLVFGLHVVVMVMFVAGGALSVGFEAGLDAAMVTAVAVAGILHRRSRGWRWARPGTRQWLSAVASVGVAILFAAALSPLAPADNPRQFPWYLIVGQIGVFNALCALRLARMAERDFVADSTGEETPAPPTLVEAPGDALRKWVGIGYRTLSMAAWLESLAFFYVHGTTLRHGSPIPVAGASEPIVEHGATVYVSPAAWALDHALMVGMMIGIPAVVLLGFLLHYAFGIPIVHDRRVPADRH